MALWNRSLVQGGNKNGSNEEIVIRLGEVVDINDEYEGSRIKVRLDQDNGIQTKDLPYAFPLLPKTLQSVPKVGEAVLVILSRLGNKNSQRYYIGPLISQPQYLYEEKFNNGRGTSNSLIQGSVSKPIETIAHYNETKGAFPDKNDIALLGRKSEDIVLKDGEIDIRCGIRGAKLFDNATVGQSNEETGLKGDVVFNNQSPAYLQLKFKRGLCKGNKQVADSVINIVADKINLISHKDEEHFNLTDQKELIKTEELDEIMAKLHQVPYGDLLFDFLQRLRSAVTNHVHPYPGLPPVSCQYITNALSFDLNTILSENVRIS